MMPTVAVVVWLLLLLAQILSAPVFSAPSAKGVQRHIQKVTTTSGIGIKTHKTKGRFEKSPINTRGKKKTTISINGKVLPLAALSAMDKNIHVTLQQSPQPGPVIGSSSLQPSPPQPLVQEVAPGTLNSQINLQGNQEPARSAPNLQVQEVPNSLSSLPQPPGTLNSPPILRPSSLNTGQEQQPNIQLGEQNLPQAPGTFRSPPNLQPLSLNAGEEQQPLHSPPNIQLGEQNLPQAPGTFRSPPNLQPSSLNTVQEQQPLHSPTNTRGQGLLQSPPLNNAQGLPQGPPNSPQNLQGQRLLSSTNQNVGCNTALNSQNPQTATTLINLGQNSEGQMTYKPLRC